MASDFQQFDCFKSGLRIDSRLHRGIRQNRMDTLERAAKRLTRFKSFGQGLKGLEGTASAQEGGEKISVCFPAVRQHDPGIQAQHLVVAQRMLQHQAGAGKSPGP